MGEARKDALRVGFDRVIKLEFHGARVSSDAGLFPYRDLDDAARLTESVAADLFDFRTGNNIRHSMTALLRQSVFSRLAGYEDTNDAERLSEDPVMRHVIGPSIKYCYDVGFDGMRVQGSFGKLSEFVYMRNWMIAQLMWDPTLDDRALMKEFLDGYYGAASPYLQKYIDLLDGIIHRGSGKFLSCYLTSTEGWLTLEDLNTATNLINQAATAVAGDATLSKRVRRLRYSVEMVWLERYEEFKKEAAEKGIAFLGPKNPQVLLKHLEKIQHEVGQYKEGREFPEYVDRLKKLFQPEQSEVEAKEHQ